MRIRTTFVHDRRGTTAIEYALIVSLISAVIYGAVQLIGLKLANDLTWFTTYAPW